MSGWTFLKSISAPTQACAVVFTRPQAVEVRESEVPLPLPENVLVSTHSSLISIGTELTTLRGSRDVGQGWKSSSTYPYEPGYSNVGVVIGVVDDEDLPLLGRRVAIHARHCSLVRCHRETLRLVPDSVSADEACFTSLAETALNGIRRIGLEIGQSVAVLGLGVLGQLAVRWSRLAGARPVYGVDPVRARRERAESAGAHVVDSRDGDEAWGLGGTDVVIEASGAPEAMVSAARMVRDQGRVLVLSSPRGPVPFDFHDLCNRPSLTIVGAHFFSHPSASTAAAGEWDARANGRFFLRCVAAGEMSVKELITHRIFAHDAPEMYGRLLDDPHFALGIILHWSEATHAV